MKRTLAVLMGMLLLVGVSTAALAKVNVTVNAGLDLAGEHEAQGARYGYNNDDTKTGLSLGVEVTSLKGQCEIGGGIELQLPRGIDNWGNSEFNFNSFYFVSKCYFQRKGPSGFVVGRIGFDTFDGNDRYTRNVTLDGDLYTAFGGGYRFGSGPVKSSLTTLYGINRGTVYRSGFGDTIDVTYSKLSLIYGVSF